MNDDPIAGQVQDEIDNQFKNTSVVRDMTAAGIQDPNIAWASDAPLIGEDEEVDLESVYLNEIDYQEGVPAVDQPGVIFNTQSQVVYDWLHKRGKYQRAVPPPVGNLASTSGNPDEPLPHMGIASQSYGLFARQVAQNVEDERLRQADQVKGADISRFGLEWAAQLMYSDVGMLRGYLQAEDMPQEVALAQATLLEMYHNLGDFTGSGTIRFIKNIVANPHTYLSFGSLGVVKNLLALGGSKAVRQSMLQRLMRTALGSSVIGAEGSAYAAGADYVGQVLEHGGSDEPFEADWTRIGIAAGIGYVGGTGLTAAGSLAVPPAVKAGTKLVRGGKKRVSFKPDSEEQPPKQD